MDPSNNNSFGSFSSGEGVSQTPVVSGGGDVVIGENKSNKFKKIMILVFVVVLIFVAILLVFVINKHTDKNNNATAKEYLNSYGGYLLYGDKEKIPQEYIDVSETYELDEIREQDLEQIENYFANLKMLYEGFLDKYKENNADQLSEELKGYLIIIDIVQRMIMLNIYINDEVLINEYLELGYTEANNYLKNIIAENNYSHDEYEKYLDNLRDYYTVFLKSLDFYDKNGCFIDRKIDATCVSDAETRNPSVVEEIRASMGAADEIKNYYEMNYYALMNSYFDIMERLEQDEY